jgi:hypothetical protein
MRAFIEHQCNKFGIDAKEDKDLAKQADQAIDSFLRGVTDWLITSRNGGIFDYSLERAIEKSFANYDDSERNIEPWDYEFNGKDN